MNTNLVRSCNARDISLREEPPLKASKNAIFILFHKLLVNDLKNIFLKFQSEIWNPSDTMRT